MIITFSGSLIFGGGLAAICGGNLKQQYDKGGKM